jgi:hypothetical protein
MLQIFHIHLFYSFISKNIERIAFISAFNQRIKVSTRNLDSKTDKTVRLHPPVPSSGAFFC